MRWLLRSILSDWYKLCCYISTDYIPTTVVQTLNIYSERLCCCRGSKIGLPFHACLYIQPVQRSYLVCLGKIRKKTTHYNTVSSPYVPPFHLRNSCLISVWRRWDMISSRLEGATGLQPNSWREQGDDDDEGNQEQRQKQQQLYLKKKGNNILSLLLYLLNRQCLFNFDQRIVFQVAEQNMSILLCSDSHATLKSSSPSPSLA